MPQRIQHKQKAKRIQRKRVRGWRMPEGAVYVGRPTRYGNPFIVGESGIYREQYPFTVTANNVLLLFEQHCKNKLREDPEYLQPLRGKDLACWCKEGSPCHADILLKLANA